MPDDAIPLAELTLPPRLCRVCAREGWHTLGELREALRDDTLRRTPGVGPVTVACAEAICANPERWRRSVHEGRAAR